MISEATAKRLIDGDETALNEIITKMTPLISSIIYNVSNGAIPSVDIEEIAADTFITLWYNRSKVMSERIEGYICTIARNKARNKVRDNQYRQTVDIDDIIAEDEFVVSDGIETKEAESALMTALDELGEPDREIILRHYFYCQPSKQIGSILNLKPETVRTKMRRAKEKLKKILNERGFIK